MTMTHFKIKIYQYIMTNNNKRIETAPFLMGLIYVLLIFCVII